ncbi:hypothetical protein Bbelb_295050 [Branchiostoma belcheri]|nr:hypothetical protein Bbelb_295050 [Branchiostoma belcheri]
MAAEIFDLDYLACLEVSSRKLESTSQQRLELMLKAQREVDTYLEQLSLDHLTGWVIPPKEVRGQVQWGPDQLEQGPPMAELLPIQENGVSTEVALQEFSRIGEEAGREGHPGHMAAVPGNSTAPGAIGDYLAASFDPHHVTFSRGAVNMQQQIVQWVGQLFGYPSTCAGNLTSGSTAAIMVAIGTARDKKVPESKDYSRSVLYISELTHDSVEKCLNALGMREAVIRQVPVDDQYRMDVNKLRKFIEDDLKDDLLPFLVVATTGTTDVGSVDPVPAIRAIATQYNMWLHVDACYGGFFMLCDSTKHLFEGVETADSISVDPHKGLYASFGTGLVLMRNGALLQNSEDLTFEQSGHFRAPSIWLPLKLYGVSTFRDALQEKLELAKYLYLRLKNQPHLHVVKPVLSVVLFRLTGASDNANNHSLLEKILADGRFFITITTVKGTQYLRACIFCFRTHRKELDVFINKVLSAVAEMGLPEDDSSHKG